MSDDRDGYQINSARLCCFKLLVVNKGFACLPGEEVINLFVSTHIRLMKDGSPDLRAHQGETPGLSGPDP